MKFLIWQNLSYPWPLPLMIWSSADREILLSLCSLMLRPSLTMIRGRMGRHFKGLMTFDSKKVNQKENDILNETFILIFIS